MTGEELAKLWYETYERIVGGSTAIPWALLPSEYKSQLIAVSRVVLEEVRNKLHT